MFACGLRDLIKRLKYWLCLSAHHPHLVVHAFSNIANIKIRNVKLASKQIKIVRYFHNDHNVPRFSESNISCVLQISSHKCPFPYFCLQYFPLFVTGICLPLNSRQILVFGERSMRALVSWQTTQT